MIKNILFTLYWIVDTIQMNNNNKGKIHLLSIDLVWRDLLYI